VQIVEQTLEGKLLFNSLPQRLRDELWGTFNAILRNYREGKWEPSELNGGKLCEVAYSILKGHVDGNMPDRAYKPRNMVDACHKLEQADSINFCRSIRIQIPRMLVALYEIRNNRGVSHIGGDVDPNHMDANAVLYISKWIMAELVRVFHNVSTEDATKAIDAIVERIIPVLWKVGDKHRILKTDLSMKEKTLVILYKVNDWVQELDLIDWVEHTNASTYRRDVLRSLHKAKYIEYDLENKRAKISPLGIREVELEIDLDL
jgi:hypothetical protein